MIEICTHSTLRACRAYQVERDPKQRFKIYTRELRPKMEREDGLMDVLLAANALGTLSGTLIAQRSLDLLKIQFPLLSRISTKFTDERFDPALVGAGYNQTIATRLVSVPAVGTYSEVNGYVSQNAETTDVAVTIDAHKFVQVEFNANETSTVRKLLAEQETAIQYAIGKDLVDSIYDLFTAENYPETPTIRALIDWDRSGVIAIGSAMQSGSAGRNANTGTRTLLLGSDYYGQLAKDPIIVSDGHNKQANGAIGSGILPEVSGYLPVDAPNISSGSRRGVGLRADAVALATALPVDYANVPGLPVTALQDVVTNPDLGLSVQLTIFSEHRGGKTLMRLAWMRGQAVGNRKCAQLLLNS